MGAWERGSGATRTEQHPGRSCDASFDTNMVIILVALLFTLLFALVLNSLTRCFIRWVRRSPTHEDGQTRRSSGSGGIQKCVLQSIPAEVYGVDGVSTVVVDICAICHNEFTDGEKVRLLPRCVHGFHIRCIDT
jgi:E3 ubiquitin-protein ligase ATL10/75/76/77/78